MSSPRNPVLDLDDLARGGYDTVVLASIDMQGRLFGRRMSASRFLEAHHEGIGVCVSVLSWPIDQAVGLEVPGFGNHTGWQDLRVRPDLATLRPATWLEHTAICVGDCFVEGTDDLVRVAPRSVLRRQLECLDAAGMVAAVGTELELYLYLGTPAELRRRRFADLVPTTLTRADYSIHEPDLYEPFFRVVRSKLDAAGIETELSQGEYGLGQWELTLRYTDPLEMADRHALFKLAMHDLAAQHGLTATFMPKVSTEEFGSSCHVHLSVTDHGGGALFWEGERDGWDLTAPMRGALGGVLHHSPDLMVLYAPTVNAYRRTSGTDFAGNGLTWGVDNRTVSCRVLGHDAATRRIEFRVPGADMNPHLGVAAMLASALDGVSANLDPGPPATGDAYTPESMRALPADLSRAAERFSDSRFARAALGDEVVDHYAAVARYEWAQFQATVTDWERERYFELI